MGKRSMEQRSRSNYDRGASRARSRQKSRTTQSGRYSDSLSGSFARDSYAWEDAYDDDYSEGNSHQNSYSRGNSRYEDYHSPDSSYNDNYSRNRAYDDDYSSGRANGRRFSPEESYDDYSERKYSRDRYSEREEGRVGAQAGTSLRNGSSRSGSARNSSSRNRDSQDLSFSGSSSRRNSFGRDYAEDDYGKRDRDYSSSRPSKASLPKSSYTGVRRNSAMRQRGSSGGGSNAAFVAGTIFAFVLAVVGIVFLMRDGLLTNEKPETLAEETPEISIFNPNIIRVPLYLDYSAFAPGAEPLSLENMDREQVIEALKKAYDWKLVVRNTNPHLDAFSMPEIPVETSSSTSSEGIDNEGTEEVVKVDNPLSSVHIHPDKNSFQVPDLIADNISQFVEQIFADYEERGEALISEAAAEKESLENAETEQESESESVETTEAKKRADYILELPDYSAQLGDFIQQLSLVWKMEAKNGDIVSYDNDSDKFVFGGARDGYEINVEETAAKLINAVKEKDYSLTIDAVGRNIPASTDSIKDKYKTIASYTTNTTSNSIRNTNIRLAARAVNGTVLQPGEEFSFNDTVGQRTEAKGYGGAAAYNQGEVVQEIGGGVCQVSTTLYNAVFKAGLTTTYRRSHTFAPSYVTPGMDATVSWPDPDYRFVNNSSHAIGIKAWYDNQTMNVQIYGVRILPEGVSWKLVSEKVADLPVPPPQIITPAEGSQTSGSAGSEWQAYKEITKDGKVERVKDHSVTYKGHPPKQYAANYQETTAPATTAETVTESSTEAETTETEAEETTREREEESSRSSQDGENSDSGGPTGDGPGISAEDPGERHTVEQTPERTSEETLHITEDVPTAASHETEAERIESPGGPMDNGDSGISNGPGGADGSGDSGGPGGPGEEEGFQGPGGEVIPLGPGGF